MNFTGGRLVLFLVTAGTAAGIWVIHDSQNTERENLHKGVLRDDELYKQKLKEFRKAN